jgi:phosphate/sulfate permease
MPRWYRLLAIAGFLLALSIGFADEVNVVVNVVPTTTTTIPQNITQPTGYFIMKSLVGMALGVGFFGAVITLLFGIDFFKTKNPFVAIVMAMIGIAVILLMFSYIWGML